MFSVFGQFPTISNTGSGFAAPPAGNTPTFGASTPSTGFSFGSTVQPSWPVQVCKLCCHVLYAGMQLLWWDFCFVGLKLIYLKCNYGTRHLEFSNPCVSNLSRIDIITRYRWIFAIQLNLVILHLVRPPHFVNISGPKYHATALLGPNFDVKY
jgi:hypothetical protein